MKQEWIDFLTSQGRHNEGLHFGHPTDELLAAQSGSVVVPLTDLGLIRASGPEAAVFLHNLLTNDIETLPANAARRCGFCTPKGRLLASLLAWHDKKAAENNADDILLALSADLHAGMLKKLSMYILRSKVKLTDASDDRVLLGLSGPQAVAALGNAGIVNTTNIADIPDAPLKTTQFPQGQVVRLGEMRYLLAIDSAAAPTVWSSLAAHVRTAGLDAWHWLEIVAGIPQITAATQEAFIPQMINYEVATVGGVNFKKGCYPGQEIVARTQYLGKIKRRMYRAHLETGVPQPGAHVYAPETGEQSCGEIVTAAPAPAGGHEVLAVIQASCAEAGEVHLDNPAGPRLFLQPLPYTI